VLAFQIYLKSNKQAYYIYSLIIHGIRIISLTSAGAYQINREISLTIIYINMNNSTGNPITEEFQGEEDVIISIMKF